MNDIEAGTKEETNDTSHSSLTGGDCIHDSASFGIFRSHAPVNKSIMFAALIFLMGLFASALVFSLGIVNIKEKHKSIFENHSLDFVNRIEESHREFEMASLSIHQLCRKRDCTRKEFRELYEYLVAGGLEVDAIGHVYNVTHDERAFLEAETEEYFKEVYPNMTYVGFKGIEDLTAATEGQPDERPIFLHATPSSERPWYCVSHFAEPQVAAGAIDFDMCSAPPRLANLENALGSWQPVLSERISFYGDGYTVLILNPGVPLSTEPELRPRDVSLIAININKLVKKAARYQRSDATVAIYDSTPQSPMFLGGMDIKVGQDEAVDTNFLPNLDLSEFHESHIGNYVYEKVIPFVDKEWTVVIKGSVAIENDEFIFVILAGSMIFLVCTIMAGWIFSSMRRSSYIHKIKARAANEKAENARKATANERALNEYLSHEIRNPLSAAIAACNFVSSAVLALDSMAASESQRQILEDINVVETSLHFIDDLLRSMLDMQHVSNRQLQVNTSPTDLKKDVFLPIMSMLFCRNVEFEVILDCPDSLHVMTDRLRLKQIVLNLVRNATEFVERGFIRLRAEVVTGMVVLYVEDSGPGIPRDKRKDLFSKHQVSFDSVSLGEGMGLIHCGTLIEMMGGIISLDETYMSGVEDYPGARFVLQLKTPPLQLDSLSLDSFHTQNSDKNAAFNWHSDPDGVVADAENKNVQEQMEIPRELSVLFVDDDMILRKLFVRAIRKVAPNWNVLEASSGEDAIKMVDNNDFDLIFMDQYMASVEKQLLGTEATHALRNKGVESIICGLSANDVEQAFYDAGADYFIFKPIPCKPGDLKSQLHKILLRGKSENDVRLHEDEQ